MKKTSSYRTAIHLSVLDVIRRKTGKRYFVLVQSGRHNTVIDCAKTKESLKSQYNNKFKKFLSRGKRQGFSKIIF